MNAFLQENVTALGTGTSEPSLSVLAVGLCAGGVLTILCPREGFQPAALRASTAPCCLSSCVSWFLAWAPAAQSIPEACRVIALSGEPVLGI